MDTAARAEALAALEESTAACSACGLVETRARVVVGQGARDADLLIVGEVPGFHEERGAAPFASDGGALLARLLWDVGIDVGGVYVTTLLKCRPPAGRDPDASELAACEPHVFRQIELVRPRVVATLGTVATRVLSGRPHPITAVHGSPLELTVRTWRTTLLPLYHPAAALYTPAMLLTLEADIARLPALLGRAIDGKTLPSADIRSGGAIAPTDDNPLSHTATEVNPRPLVGAAVGSSAVGAAGEPGQLGLF